MESIPEEDIGERDRFRPGDLVRVLADGPSLRRSFRQVGLEWNGACAKYSGQVGVIQKSLGEGRLNVAFVHRNSDRAADSPGFVGVDHEGQVAIFHQMFSSTSVDPCLAACFLPGEMAIVFPDAKLVAFVNRESTNVLKFEPWAGQLVRIVSTDFGVITVQEVDGAVENESKNKSIDLTPPSLIPVLDAAEPSQVPDDSIDLKEAVGRWKEASDLPYKSIFERSETPASEDMKAFYSSIETKNADAVDAFLKRYPNAVNRAMGPAGETALMYAVKTNELATVKLLLQCGANPLVKCTDGLSAFDIFFELEQHGDVRILDRLLDHSLPDANIFGNSGLTPLHEAVSRRLLPFVSVLLKSKRIDVNAQDKGSNSTALHYIIASGADDENDIAYVSLLLDHGAEICIADMYGLTSFHLAARHGKLGLLLHMLNKDERLGDVQKAKDGWTALHIAAVNGHVRVVEELAKNCWCSISAKTLTGQSVMHLMMASLQLEIYKHHNTGIDGRNYRSDWFRVIDILVQSGASLDEIDDNNESPIHMAIQQLCLAVVAGRKPNAEIIHQLFFLDKKCQDLELLGDLLPICESWPQLAVACFLLAKGASITVKNTKQLSVLHSCPPEFRYLLFYYHKRYRNMHSSISPQMLMIRQSAVDAVLLCLFCEGTAGVKLQPCGHAAPVCVECAFREAVISIKRCSACRQLVTHRTTNDGRPIRPSQSKDADLTYQQKLQELEELKSTLMCSICSDRDHNTVFQCGHVTCAECSRRMSICPFCSKKILTRTRIFRP